MNSKFVRICFSLALLLLPLATARADDDEHKRVKNMFESVQDDYHSVLKLRDRYGSSRHMEDEFARAQFLYSRLTKELDLRHPPYGLIHDELKDLRDVVDHLRDEYHSYPASRSHERYRVIEQRTSRTYRYY